MSKRKKTKTKPNFKFNLSKPTPVLKFETQNDGKMPQVQQNTVKAMHNARFELLSKQNQTKKTKDPIKRVKEGRNSGSNVRNNRHPLRRKKKKQSKLRKGKNNL